MQDNNRSRGSNWSQEEKDIFLEIMKKSAPIIENKSTDTNTNKKKILEWVEVQKRMMELCGIKRDIGQLKGFWRRTKLSAKKNISTYKRDLYKTGGGNKPPSPSLDDLKVMDICPTDFVVDENEFDSNSIYKTDQAVKTGKNEEKEIIFDDDIAETVADEGDVTFINEGDISIVTVETENNEVNIVSENNSRFKKGQFKNKKNKVINKNNIPSQKAQIFETNINFKKHSLILLDEEHALKVQYLKNELTHQEYRQKMEKEILLLEKKKKEIELDLLKKKL